jgi:ankyrin repeat protein
MLVDSIEDSLRERRPSRDEQFAARLMDILTAARSGDTEKVKELLELDPGLLAARDPLGNTALIMAVNFGRHEVAELLLAAGVQPGLHEAAAIGSTERVAAHLSAEPESLDSYSEEGFTALGLAAHFGHLETAEFLIGRGADVNNISKHEMGVTPLHAALFGRRPEMAMLLLNNGANPLIKRGGKGWPRAGWTALHYAAGFGFVSVVELLLERGALIDEIDETDDEGKTPLDVAVAGSQSEVVEILRRFGGC